MKNTTSIVSALTVLALAAMACVTINVYFPEAAIRDMSEQIEEEVQKQAAEAPAEPAPGEEAAAEAQSSGLLDILLGVTPAYAAEDVPDPGITNPAIRQLIKSRAARVEQIDAFKNLGVLGENNQALLEARDLESLKDLKQRAELQRLLKGENNDREQLFKEIAAAQQVDLSQLPRIRETYAQTIRDKAKAGHWIQLPDGTWKRK